MADRTVRYVFTGSFGNLTAGLTAAGRNVTELGAKMTALDKNGAKMRAGLTAVGDTAGKIGLVAAGGLALAIGAAVRFDKAMSNVQAATHETAANMDLLRKAAIKAGADTAFSASEAAAGIEELAKAGVATKDILAGGLSGALNLAAAGNLSVADAAETAATAMTQFGLSGNQVNHIADLLASGAGHAQGSVADLGMALKQSGLVAAQMGLSIEDTTGALAAMASAGLVGSDAGTSLKAAMLALQSPSQKAADLMSSLGISAYDAQGNFVGLTNLSGQLQAAFAGQTQATRDAALSTIFGSDAIRTANVLYKEGADGIQNWVDKTDEAGYAATTAAQRMDNLAGDLEQLKGSLETALIGAGEGSQGPLRSLVQGTTQVVNALGSIPGPAQTAATALLAVTAVAGGGLWFGAKVVEGTVKMKAAMKALGIEAVATREKLALVGTGGFAAALGVGTFLDTLSRMDSMSRSSDAANATVESFQDLSDALSYSNIGKYADDLHINLGRLTQDLAENGASGEYVQRVLADLADSQDGFGDKLKAFAGEDLPFYTGETLKAERAQDDLQAIIKAGAGVLGKTSQATDAAAESEKALAVQQGYASVEAMKAANAQKQLSAELRKQREDARGVAQSFIGLGDSLDDSKKSLSQWLRELEQQNEALRNFTANAQRAAKRGLDEGLIQSLNEAGPAGALRMKQLANATDAELDRANRAWRKGQAAIDAYVKMAVPPKKVDVDASRAFDKLAAIKYALAQLRDKTITINTVQRTSYLNKQSGIPTPGGQADGGTIPGQRAPYGDKMLYMLAPGEEVISNRRGQADRYRGVLKAINNAADGATVGAGGTPLFRGLTSPDFGIGTAAQYAANALTQFGKLGEKELQHRAKLLDRQENLAQKALDQAKERLDEERAQLKALRDARKEFEQSVTSNFRTDVFGGGVDLVSAAMNNQIGDNFNGLVQQFAQQQMDAARAEAERKGQAYQPDNRTQAEWIQAYLDTLSSSQIANLQAQASVGQLQQDSVMAGAFDYVLGQLRDMGLTGGAYQELAASGDYARAQAYLNLGPDFIKNLMTEFKQRDQDLKNLGVSVGNAQFGADIREQLKETRQATRVMQESRDSLRTIERAQHAIARELAEIKRDAPKKTGEATADAINNAVTHGQRKG